MSTAEIKYPKRFLDLNMNSPVEDSKLAYDEMAACWEKVTMTTSFENSTVLQILSEFVFLRIQLPFNAFGRFAYREIPNQPGALKDDCIPRLLHRSLLGSSRSLPSHEERLRDERLCRRLEATPASVCVFRKAMSQADPFPVLRREGGNWKQAGERGNEGFV